MAISQIPLASTGLTTADIAPLARTSDLSTLATTSGLITQPQWTLLATNSCSSAAQTQTISGLNSFNYRKLRLVMRIGSANTNTSNYLLRINSIATTSYISFGNHIGFLSGGSLGAIGTHAYDTSYFLTARDAIQYGYLNAGGYAPILGIVDISNANNTDDKHIESSFSYRTTATYSATVYNKGILVSPSAIISSISIIADNTTIDNSGGGFGIKVYGSN